MPTAFSIIGSRWPAAASRRCAAARGLPRTARSAAPARRGAAPASACGTRASATRAPDPPSSESTRSTAPVPCFTATAIQSFNAAVTTRGLRRRSATVRLEVNSSACRSPATTVRTAASAPATPPVCCARNSGSAMPARSAPSARAFATSRPCANATRGDELHRRADRPPHARHRGRGGDAPRGEERAELGASGRWTRSCSTRTQLVPPSPLTSMVRTPQSTRRRATAGPMPQPVSFTRKRSPNAGHQRLDQAVAAAEVAVALGLAQLLGRR